MSFTFILLTILTLARLAIALQLFLTARRSHLNNLYWLAGLFALAVYSIFTPTDDSPLSNLPLFLLGFLAGHYCLAIFIHTTFHRDRQGPVQIVIVLLIVATITTIYALFVTKDTNLAGMMTTVGLVNWVWHFIVARSAYLKIVNDSEVENWVKGRYRLMIIYIPMMMLITVQVTASTTNLSPYVPRIFLPIGLLIIITSIILQFLVWVMPEPFRLWLNRTQQVRPSKEPRTAPNALDVFGNAMTRDTGLNTIACFYAIRSTVAKKIGSQDSDAVREYISTMTYHEWDAILQHTELNRILINGGADKNTANQAILNARQALVEKQSLLTLSTR